MKYLKTAAPAIAALALVFGMAGHPRLAQSSAAAQEEPDQQQSDEDAQTQKKAEQADAAAKQKISALFKRMHVTSLGDMDNGCENSQAADTNTQGYLVERDRDHVWIQTCIDVTIDSNTNDVSIDISGLNYQVPNTGNSGSPSP